MLRRTASLLAPASLAVTKSSLVPLEALTQIQLGITPPLSVQRGFLLEHCGPQLQQRGITEAKLVAMDGKLCAQLLKRVVLEQYLSVPFRVFSFDMEFTGPPVFTADGPTEDITEMGLYSPVREDTFSCLVKPACGRKQRPGVTELTHITDEMLEKEGLPFVDAWNEFLRFVSTPEPGEVAGAERRILLLSHGGKLADVSLIKWTLEKFDLELPDSFVFGDTIHLIRDAHRRRPVTVDKHPPSWKLLDLVQWLRIPPTLPAHRAGNDAKMTWDALYHTLLRYGDDELTPREQLVSRFFDEEAKARMKERQAGGRVGGEGMFSGEEIYLAADAGASASGSGAREDARAVGGSGGTVFSEDPLDLDLDDIFNDSTPTSSRQLSSPATVEDETAASNSFDAESEGGVSSAENSGRSTAEGDRSEDKEEGQSDLNASITPTTTKPRNPKGKAGPSKKKLEPAAKKTELGEADVEEVFLC